MFSVLFTPCVAADWLQFGHDAARTNHTPDPGPSTDDVAWTLRLPGGLSPPSGPLIVGDDAYILTRGLNARESQDFGTGELDVGGVFRIPLDTAQPELIIPLNDPPFSQGAHDTSRFAFASDGERFFITRTEVVEAYPLEGGVRLWEWKYPELLDGTASTEVRTRCIHPVVQDGVVYLACQQHQWNIALLGFNPYNDVAFVAALDAATGKNQWTWARDVTATVQHHAWDNYFVDELGDLFGLGGDRPSCLPSGSPPTCLSRASVILHWMTVARGHVVLVTEEQIHSWITGGVSANGEMYAWMINRTTGRQDWGQSTSTNEINSFATTLRAGVAEASPRMPSQPLADGDLAFVRLSDSGDFLGGPGLEVLNLSSRRSQGGEALSDPRDPPERVGSSFAGGHRELFASSYNRIYRLGPSDDPTDVIRPGPWFTQLPAEAGQYFPATNALVLANGTLFAYAVGDPDAAPGDPTERDAVFAFSSSVDPELGGLAWSHDFGHPRYPSVENELGSNYPYHYFGTHQFAVGRGVLVMAGLDGAVTVLGRTGASIQIAYIVSNPAPMPGETFLVDLAATRAAAHGVATGYRVDWGDGQATDWQEASTFRHSYVSAGDYAATLFARNHQGESARTRIAFAVGATTEEPPERPFEYGEGIPNVGPGVPAFELGVAAVAMMGAWAVRRRRQD